MDKIRKFIVSPLGLKIAYIIIVVEIILFFYLLPTFPDSFRARRKELKEFIESIKEENKPKTCMDCHWKDGIVRIK